jgi:hypothetical protein
MKMETSISRLLVVLIVVALVTELSSTIILHDNKYEAIALEQSQQLPSSSLSLPNIVTIQNTSMSVPAPNAPVNKQNIPHQIVL